MAHSPNPRFLPKDQSTSPPGMAMPDLPRVCRVGPVARDRGRRARGDARGGGADHRECHIGGDFLLIYRLDENTIIFVRAGTHSDLFEE